MNSHDSTRGISRADANSEPELPCSTSFTADKPINSYHAARTLSLMDAYRIGYVLEPWTNLTPPIRGGVYQKSIHGVDEDTGSSIDTDTESDSDRVSVASSVTSLGSSASCNAAGDVSKVDSSHVPYGYQQDVRRRRDKDVTQAISVAKLSPDAYIASAIRSEIEDGIRDYPSLDQETQRGINLKVQEAASTSQK